MSPPIFLIFLLVKQNAAVFLLVTTLILARSLIRSGKLPQNGFAVHDLFMVPSGETECAGMGSKSGPVMWILTAPPQFLISGYKLLSSTFNQLFQFQKESNSY